MRYLLDTHIILWWFSDLSKLNLSTKAIIQDKANTIFLSAASFWEMAIKKSVGRLKFPHNLIETARLESFQILSIQPEESLGVADLPLLHADPFDRLLIMQAKLYDLVLITKDALIVQYPVVTLMA